MNVLHGMAMKNAPDMLHIFDDAQPVAELVNLCNSNSPEFDGIKKTISRDEVHAMVHTGRPAADLICDAYSAGVYAVLGKAPLFTWHPISTPPSDARIVLLFCPSDEYPVWPGYFNGGWLHADGWDVAPTNWADMPEGPDVALINEGKTDVPAIDFGYMQSKASSKKLEVKP